MIVGADVVYVGCAHPEPCPELVRPCSVPLYGPMELRTIREDGRLVARLEDGSFELFEANELDTAEAVAARAAAALDHEAA